MIIVIQCGAPPNVVKQSRLWGLRTTWGSDDPPPLHPRCSMYGIFHYITGTFLGFLCRQIFQHHGSYGHDSGNPEISSQTNWNSLKFKSLEIHQQCHIYPQPIPWRIRIRMPWSWCHIYHQYTPVMLAYIAYIFHQHIFWLKHFQHVPERLSNKSQTEKCLFCVKQKYKNSVHEKKSITHFRLI